MLLGVGEATSAPASSSRGHYPVSVRAVVQEVRLLMLSIHSCLPTCAALVLLVVLPCEPLRLLLIVVLILLLIARTSAITALVQRPLKDVLAKTAPKHDVRLDLYVGEVEAVFGADGKDAVLEVGVVGHVILVVAARNHALVLLAVLHTARGRGFLNTLLLLRWLLCRLDEDSPFVALVKILS